MINYRLEILPYMQDLLSLKSSMFYCVRFYYFNSTIPEIYDFFYKIGRLEDRKPVIGMLGDDGSPFLWEMTHRDTITGTIHACLRNSYLLSGI